MPVLHGYGPAWDTIDLSPFVVKLHAWLRLAGQPFESRVSDVRRMPRRKLPALALDDGRLLSDSQAIIELLRGELGDPLGDARLSADQRATQRALQALLESELYFAAVRRRWMPEANWALLKPEIEGYLRRCGIPSFITGFVAGKVRAQVLAQAMAQGMGRRDEAEVDALAVSAWQTVAHFLGEQAFIAGDRPCSFDATVFAFLHTLLGTPIASPAADWVRGHPALSAYHQRLLGLVRAPG